MSEENSGIQVGAQGDCILVRVDGRGTHLNSHLLKQYLIQCLEENRAHYQIDLSRCTYMDSTFLGMLAGIGGKIKEKAFSPIELLNPTERVKGMLEGLGIDHLFNLVSAPSQGGPLEALQGKEESKEEKAREMLAAHEKLVEVSKGNEAKFRDVIGMLRDKVRKP